MNLHAMLDVAVKGDKRFSLDDKMKWLYIDHTEYDTPIAQFDTADEFMHCMYIIQNTNRKKRITAEYIMDCCSWFGHCISLVTYLYDKFDADKYYYYNHISTSQMMSIFEYVKTIVYNQRYVDGGYYSSDIKHFDEVER